MPNVEKIYAKCPYNEHLADIWVEGYLKCLHEVEHDKEVNQDIVQEQKPKRRRRQQDELPDFDFNLEAVPKFNAEAPVDNAEAIPFGNGIADQIADYANAVNVDANANIRFVNDHFEII